MISSADSTVDNPTEELPDGVIEIHDPEIDPAQIMEQIRDRVRQRRKESDYPRRMLPMFGAAAYPGEPEKGDPELYYHLRQANELYYQIGVEATLASSPATRLPILGPVWKLIRREAHNLVLFYLGKLTQQQVTVNRHLVSTLNRMVVQMQEQQAEIKTLRQELEQLQQASK